MIKSIFEEVKVMIFITLLIVILISFFSVMKANAESLEGRRIINNIEDPTFGGIKAMLLGAIIIGAISTALLLILFFKGYF